MDLTKILKASIELETKTMNKLTDFPSDVLRAMLGAAIYKGEHLKDHVKRIHDYGADMRKLMAGELVDLNKEIELLDTAEIQIATALVMVEREEKSIQN